MAVKDIFRKIIWWAYILLLIFLIITVLRRIIYGGSDVLIVGLLLANLGYSWYINSQLQRHMGEHEGYKKGLANRLSKKKENFKTP